MCPAKQLIESCSVPMVLLDEEDRAIFVNSSFTKTLGYTLEDIPDVEHWFTAAYPEPGYRQRWRAMWEDACARGRKAGMDCAPSRRSEVVCKDGTKRTVEVHGANIGKASNLIIFVDVSGVEARSHGGEPSSGEASKALGGAEARGAVHSICSYCKKVRDQDDAWVRIEQFLYQHSTMVFSHGMCPECSQIICEEMGIELED